MYVQQTNEVSEIDFIAMLSQQSKPSNERFDSISILKVRLKEMQDQLTAAFTCGNSEDYDSVGKLVTVMKRDIQILEINRS
ncbi:MAG: hypothetical protein COA36_16810 [Desulfotalea sp.]|nr:MAG: hypothetical protein COA36_16810 [Desulfotalea sp.]